MTLNIEVTKKGKPLILYNGKKFREGYSLKSGEVVWRCLGKNCSATVKTDGERKSVTTVNDKHSGPHPVTIRSLTSPLSRSVTSTPTASPSSESLASPASTTHHPPVLTTPSPVTPDDLTHHFDLSVAAQEITPTLQVIQCQPSTHDVSQNLLAENVSLKKELDALRIKMKTVLDHSVESDQRLIQYTSEVFALSPAPRDQGLVTTSTKHQFTQTDQSSDQQTCTTSNILTLEKKLAEQHSEIKLLKENIGILSMPCKKCQILKEESSNMITTIRCLEEELENIKYPVSKISNLHKPSVLNSLMENTIIPVENRFQKLTEMKDTDDSCSFKIVEHKKKKRNKRRNKRQQNDWRSKIDKHDNLGASSKSSKVNIKFKNVTILGDSHSRHIAGLVRGLVQTTTTVSGMCKPGAGLLSIAPQPALEPLANHCYVLMAGTNDVTAGRRETNFCHLERIIKQCRTSSRVVVATLPRRHDLKPGDPVHRSVSLVNNYIREICHRCEGVEVVDLDSIQRRHFTSHGLHLRMSGKRILAQQLAKTLANLGTTNSRLGASATKQTSPRPTPAMPAAAPPALPQEPITLRHESFADAVKAVKETSPSKNERIAVAAQLTSAFLEKPSLVPEEK